RRRRRSKNTFGAAMRPNNEANDIHHRARTPSSRTNFLATKGKVFVNCERPLRTSRVRLVARGEGKPKPQRAQLLILFLQLVPLATFLIARLFGASTPSRQDRAGPSHVSRRPRYPQRDAL